MWEKSDVPYVIIDDLQINGVKRAHGELVKRGKVETIYKQYYTAVLPSWMRNNPAKKPVNVPIEVLRKK